MDRPVAELSWWLAEAHAGDFTPAPPLHGTTRADVCIVGGGFSGLWTALHLKELDPSADVVLLESGTCGSGASGRNGGFALSWWAKLATLVKLFGAEEGLRLAQASVDSIAAIGAFCERHGIDAHFRPQGWLWAATNRAQVDSWSEAIDVAERYGHAPFTPVPADEAAAWAGSATHLGGVFDPSAATVQPALLALGMRRVALEHGVRIHEHTAMESWHEERGVRVATPGGAVDADTMVLATNAWMVREPEIARMLAVVTSDMIITRPIPDLLARTGPRDGLAVSDSRMLVNYYRTTQDHRLAFGHGGGSFGFGRRVGAKFNGRSARAGAVSAAMTRLYPRLTDDLVETSWTGPIDRSISSLPVFGRLRGSTRVLYGVGYSGNGVGPSHLGGRVLASLALGRHDEWSTGRIARGPVGTYPPEPVKYLGGVALRGILAHKERTEDSGKRPGPVVRAASRLAPPGLVPVRRNSKADPDVAPRG